MNQGRKRQFERKDIVIAGWVFVCVCSIYLLTMSGWVKSDGYYYYVAAIKLASGQRPTIEDYRFIDHRTPLSAEGERTTQYGIGWSAALVPIILLSNLLRGRLYTPPESRVLQMTVSSTTSFISAAAVFLMYLVLRKLGYRRRTCVMVALLLGFSTMLWTDTRSELFTEPIATLGITCALLASIRHRESGNAASAAIAGLCIAYLTTVKIYWILLIFPFLILLFQNRSWKRIENLCAFLAPFVIAAGAIVLYNKVRFGTFVAEGYLGGALTKKAVLQAIKGQPMTVGLYGLLVSPGKGVFLFNPPLILSLFGAPLFWKESRQLAWFCLIACGGYVLFFASRPTWDGANFWGPRHLCPLLPVMMLPAACLLDKVNWRSTRARIWFGIVTAAGIVIQIPNLFIQCGTYTGIMVKTGRLRWEEVYFIPNLSPIIGNWVLFKDSLVNLVTGEPIFLYPVKVMRGVTEVLEPVYCVDFENGWDSWINVVRPAGFMDVLQVKIAVFAIVALLIMAAIFAGYKIRASLKQDAG